jgi:hypothetical protein
MFLKNKIIAHFFIIISMLFLANCSFSNTSDDIFSSVANVFDSAEDEAFAVPNDTEKPSNTQTMADNKKLKVPYVLPKLKQKPVKKAVIAKKNQTIATEKCNQRLFLHQRNVSNLYGIYLKNKKICQKIDDKKVNKHFIDVLIKHYSTQDVRILNADKEFMALYATAIKDANIADKVNLNKQILNHGCHLLNQEACILVKKSLY